MLMLKGNIRQPWQKVKDLEEFMKILNYSSRENGRTPMQWNRYGECWFHEQVRLGKKVNGNYTEINVAAQNEAPNSILNHFRKMTKIRKDNPVLVYGDYELLQKEHPTIYAFTRTLDDEKILVMLNFSQETSSITLPEISRYDNTIINNYNELEVDNNRINLLPYQAVILKIK